VDAEVGTEATTSDPTPVPTPTPVLIYYKGASPSPTPEPKPDLFIERMKRDQVAQDLKAEVPGIARRIAPNWTGVYDIPWLAKSLELYVPVYMASTCLDGAEPSTEGFRDMVTAGVVIDSPSQGKVRWNLESLAHRLIQTIREEGKGQKAATNFCLQSYLYPESVSDAAPAIDLYLTITFVNFSPDDRENYASIVNDHAADWFNTTEPRQPFIIWLCEWSSGNLCGL
jgi:hypothetical protein